MLPSIDTLLKTGGLHMDKCLHEASSAPDLLKLHGANLLSNTVPINWDRELDAPAALRKNASCDSLAKRLNTGLTVGSTKASTVNQVTNDDMDIWVPRVPNTGVQSSPLVRNHSTPKLTMSKGPNAALKAAKAHNQTNGAQGSKGVMSMERSRFTDKTAKSKKMDQGKIPLLLDASWSSTRDVGSPLSKGSFSSSVSELSNALHHTMNAETDLQPRIENVPTGHIMLDDSMQRSRSCNNLLRGTEHSYDFCNETGYGSVEPCVTDGYETDETADDVSEFDEFDDIIPLLHMEGSALIADMIPNAPISPGLSKYLPVTLNAASGYPKVFTFETGIPRAAVSMPCSPNVGRRTSFMEAPAGTEGAAAAPWVSVTATAAAPPDPEMLQCRIAGYNERFSSQHGVVTHMKQAHHSLISSNGKKPKPDKLFVCTHANCNKRFARNDELTRHLRTHTGLKPFACTVCGLNFTRADHLKAHTRKSKRHLKRLEIQQKVQASAEAAKTTPVNMPPSLPSFASDCKIAKDADMNFEHKVDSAVST